MEYRKIGKTDLKVSRIAFGCYPIGGHNWGKVKDSDSISAVRKALDLGINFFDTADIYGLGHSEEVLSKALDNCRKTTVIMTKVGLRWDARRKVATHDLSAEHIKKSVEASLRRLRIERIPLYQIHYPDRKTPPSETMDALLKLRKEGKIQHIGASNISLKLIEEFQKYGRIESLQIPYNIFNQEFSKTARIIFKKWGISSFSYGSLAQGLLTGKFDQNTKFGKDDHRSKDRNFKGKRFLDNLALVEEIRKLGVKYNKTCSQVALNWILKNYYITAVLVGAKTPEQVEQNIGALHWQLNNRDYELINKWSRMI